MDAGAIEAADAKVRQTVESILDDVKKRGNTAIRELDRKSTRLNSSHIQKSRMPSSA